MRCDLGLERIDAAPGLGELQGQKVNHPAGELGHAAAGVGHPGQQPRHVPRALGSITPNSARWPRSALIS